ncbi:hypothetical protein [Pseudoalteromonas galatheae]|uniref:hypothetical protein n=1 Tax=Pseudoalteromonas galatheae TaxID=579562 RepID=UPI0030CC9F51
MDELYNNTISHLKQINFTLLILTTILVVMSLLAEKSKIETAIDDVTNLKTAFKEIHTAKPISRFGDEWLTQKAEKIISENNITFAEFYVDRDKSETNRIKVNYTGYLIENALRLYPALSFSPVDTRGEKPLSLANIKKFWNGLYSVRRIIYVNKILPIEFRFDSNENKLGYIQTSIYEDGSQFTTPSENLSLVDIFDEEWFESQFTHLQQFPSLKENTYRSLLSAERPSRYLLFGGRILGVNPFNFDGGTPTEASVFSNRLLIPVKTQEQPFTPMEMLVAEVPEKFGWKSGSFSLNFSELEELTEGFQDIEISKIQTILKNELARTSGTVNAFGLSLPFEILSKFGAVAIFLLMLYFFFYLRFFHSYFDTTKKLNMTIPWIYLHDRADAIVLFYFVSIIYPTAVAVNLTLQNTELQYSPALFVNIAIILLCVGLSTKLTMLIMKNRSHTFF